MPENGFLPEGSKNFITAHQLDADADLLNTFHIRLLAGKYFRKERTSDADGYIINQALADELGWDDPIGKTISRDGIHEIIGVVDNFHFASLHDKIEPLIITNKPWLNRYGFLAVRYNTDQPAEMINRLQAVWKQTVADAPFDYWFLDEAYNNLYRSEERFRQLFLGFSILSILLSLAGVFGLVFAVPFAKKQKKEIGIRKVLGAGVIDIMRLTTTNFFYPDPDRLPDRHTRGMVLYPYLAAKFCLPDRARMVDVPYFRGSRFVFCSSYYCHTDGQSRPGQSCKKPKDRVNARTAASDPARSGSTPRDGGVNSPFTTPH